LFVCLFLVRGQGGKQEQAARRGAAVHFSIMIIYTFAFFIIFFVWAQWAAREKLKACPENARVRASYAFEHARHLSSPPPSNPERHKTDVQKLMRLPFSSALP
jgi:hypothetical protein